MKLVNKNGDKITIDENLGSSFETAIIIHAKNDDDGVMAEYYYLGKKLGENKKDWQVDLQSLIKSDAGKYFDKMDITLKDGTKKSILFDITEYFKK